MPVVTGVFFPVGAPGDGGAPPPSAALPAATVKQLHDELAAIGMPVAAAETGATPVFGTDTSARLKDLQERYKLPVRGNLDPVTGGILTLSALAATETDKTKLKALLKGAVDNVPNSPDYNNWLARYAIMAGDYDLAARTSPHLRDLSGILVNLGDLVLVDGWGPAVPKQPEVPFPENFYSYRYPLMTADDIRTLRSSQDQFPYGALPYMARMNVNPGDPPDMPDKPPGLPLPPPVPVGPSRGPRLAISALAWLDAIEAWQFGNSEFAQQRYASAVDAYDRCCQAIINYFSSYPDYGVSFQTGTLDSRVDELIWAVAGDRTKWAALWSQVDWRRQLLSLAEIGQLDWTPIGPGHIVYQLLQGNLKGSDQPPPPTDPIGPRTRMMLMDAKLLIMAAVLVPLAQGEANRLRRQYEAAHDSFSRVLRRQIPSPTGSTTLSMTVSLPCEFIEFPFARLLLMETMLDQAEAQYKARTSIDDETDATVKAAELARLDTIAQDFTARQIPGDPTPGALPLQHLLAALTYANVFDAMNEDGDYVARAKQALTTLHANLKAKVTGGDVTSLAFRSVAQAVTIPTVSAIGNALPGLTSGTHPHEAYLQITAPAGQQAMRETNPRVYALLLQAQARLLEIWNGFNYLGYRDDYVPPWRFAYLLDRARYFAEHAKNAQRDYLNFLANAENEEYKEMSAAQNVEFEKVNVQIETARVDQAGKELAAAQESQALADIHAQNAQAAVSDYADFKAKADEADAKSLIGSILGGELEIGIGIVTKNPIAVAKGGLDLFNSIWGGSAKFNAAATQRSMELHNLKRSAAEAELASKVAAKNTEVAQAGLVVAGLQRQAALLRHEFALQSLQFMRNQILNAEQWYRLAGAIRSVSDSYLRYAIEISFLAQQSYNFESDRRLNVIRFDYDLSVVGAMLAADFLLRDLDTLEQDLIVSQQTKLQQVRYVLSMARESPETLQKLGDTGSAFFGLRLEELERHFPGLLNMRISSVTLQPVALMDPTLVSVELTQLGAGQIRLTAQPGTSPLNSSDLAAADNWLAAQGAAWPVKIHLSGPESALFSGLGRDEAGALSAITANERRAFEGLPGASSWRIDLSAKENQILPGTLADMVITFTLSGYYDPDLKNAVVAAAAAPRPFATTSLISARQLLPDAYYSLVQDGKLVWDVSAPMLSQNGSPRELRNLSIFLLPAADGPELGRGRCRYPIEIEVAASSVRLATALPEFTLTPNGLTLNAALTGAAGTDVTWDFGDGTPLAQSVNVQHKYPRSGRYEVTARLVKDRRLAEYRCAVVVSASHPVTAPLIAAPNFTASAAGSDGNVMVSVSLADATLSLECAAGAVRGWADGGPASLKLMSGRYLLDFQASRKISARFYSKQRYLPGQALELSRGRIASDRTFDLDSGAETSTSLNSLGSLLFRNGSSAVTISPVDRWTLELPAADNPWLVTTSASDIAGIDASEFADAILGLEFMGLSL
jgi:hypothetical protein